MSILLTLILKFIKRFINLRIKVKSILIYLLPAH